MSDEGKRALLHEVVAEAAEKAGGERAAYLDRAGAGDAGLRAEVESLLSALDRDEQFIPRAA
jgi:hypothetical protein